MKISFSLTVVSFFFFLTYFSITLKIAGCSSHFTFLIDYKLEKSTYHSITVILYDTINIIKVCVCLVAQLCLTLCARMDCSL